MSAVDWSTMTPHQIRLALESAPKVAGPWTVAQEAAENGTVYEWRASGHETLCWVGPDDSAWDDPKGVPYFDTRSAADVHLVGLGYLLDDEE